ncbi:restriction endonuclease subunit S [Propionibacterium freudenreichii]|uniref:restriction endonuclease subunit S n=1 Tax=Propionibacterium freudenreichii TaxID=1744 RepID=UPI0005438C2D|nr:restriction endonuclease subunit S [Propionibacterium freudenreichii]CEG92749.1 Type I restriction-modification system specificity subunit [Propionibacterium freudenreichii]
MFRDLTRYEAYEVAGDWVSEVPRGWGWEPARTIFAERKVTGFIDEQMLSVTIGRGVLPQADLIASTSKKDSSNIDKSKYKLVEPGDIVYNKMRAWQGAAGMSQHRGIVSPAYIVMTPRSVRPEYLHHVVRTPMFAKEAERWSYGITSDQWSLRPEHFKMIRFPVPPPEEQAAIVKYLAHANARINKAIATKRRLISLLEEQKIAEVNSVIEVDWPRVPIKRALRSMTAGAWGSAPDESNDPARWCVRVADFDYPSGGVADSPKTYRAIADREFSKRSLRRRDLLLEGSGGGEKTPVGRVVLFNHNDDALCSNFLQRLRPSDNVVPEFLSLMLRRVHASGEVRRYIKQTTGIQNLDLGAYMTHEIPMPSIREQQRAVSNIDAVFRGIDVVAVRVKQEIALLREFRTRLVADVVTGQVDVRAIAATLPDASEEDVPLLDEELVDAVEGDDE